MFTHCFLVDFLYLKHLVRFLPASRLSCGFNRKCLSSEIFWRVKIKERGAKRMSKTNFSIKPTGEPATRLVRLLLKCSSRLSLADNSLLTLPDFFPMPHFLKQNSLIASSCLFNAYFILGVKMVSSRHLVAFRRF